MVKAVKGSRVTETVTNETVVDETPVEVAPVETNGDVKPGKKVPLSLYKGQTGFNASEYLRGLIAENEDINTEQAWERISTDHPLLLIEKEKLAQALSNSKTKIKRDKEGGGPTPTKVSHNYVTMDQVMAAKGIVKEHGGLDTVLASIEAYRKVSALVTALGGEEKAVKILTMMDELRKE